MNLTLTKEQELVRQMVRDFAVNEVKPIAAEIDVTERFPMENVKKMGELGMMGIPFPTEFGGAGGDVLSYILAVEELSKVCATTGVILSAHTSLCASLINENLNVGTYEYEFNAAKLNSGIYFYRINAEGFTSTKKMILIKWTLQQRGSKKEKLLPLRKEG